MEKHQEIDFATAGTDDYLFCDGEWVYIGKRTHDVFDLDDIDKTHMNLWEKQILRLAR